MMPQTPPKLPLHFLRWFCTEERLEEVEGDLFEVWWEQLEASNQSKANWLYWWLVFRSLRRFALKRNKTQYKSGFIMFFIHHLKVTNRNLRKHKVTTSINVLGLAIGISAFIAIINVVNYERSFDHHIPDGDRIYRIHTRFTGIFNGQNRGVSTALVPYLRENESDFETITAFYTRRFEGAPAAIDGQSVEKYEGIKSIFADSMFFKVFRQYEWLHGDQETALDEPYQVVLTQEQANKYFGDKPLEQVIGQQMTYQDSLTTTVSGIVKPFLGNSDFIFTDVISMSTARVSWIKDSYQIGWSGTSSNSQAWVKMPEPVTDLDSAQFLKAANAHVAELEKDESYYKHFHLQPLSELHFWGDIGIFDFSDRSPADKQTLLILSLVSLAVLLIAVFNFINLESAQVSSKSREAGVRKVIGGNTGLLLQRFLTESLVVTFMAVLLSIPLAYFGLIYFENFLPNPIPLNWEDPYFWLLLGIIFLVVGILSGLYPAILLSSVKTSNALKASSYNAQGKHGLPFFRRMFISFQFAFSQLLLICTIAASLQLSFMLKKDMGFEQEDILFLETPWGEPKNKQEILINYLESDAKIAQVQFQEGPPAGGGGYSTDILTYVTDEAKYEIEVERKAAAPGYLDFYGIPLLAGELWTSEDREDQLVVSEAFVRKMGLKHPADAVGESLKGWQDKSFTIVGVMQDFHTRSLRTEILPVMYVPLNGWESSVAMKIKTSEMKEAIEQISSHWSKVYPDDPAEVKFLDESIGKYYEAEQQTSRLSGFTTIIAILISSLGLFGLVSLTIVHRTKEVGIRKVLGASVLQIGILITSEFLIMTLIAFCLAVPVAYYAIDYWMDSFAYRIDISWWVYAVGGIASLIVALIAISSKVYRSTQTNPVEALRYE
ncbi:MAG: ABC transporter permease [Cytophagales bacterium]|nr:ABC transporter permease [Cytophagales bacterium]